MVCEMRKNLRDVEHFLRFGILGIFLGPKSRHRTSVSVFGYRGVIQLTPGKDAGTMIHLGGGFNFLFLPLLG